MFEPPVAGNLKPSGDVKMELELRLRSRYRSPLKRDRRGDGKRRAVCVCVCVKQQTGGRELHDVTVVSASLVHCAPRTLPRLMFLDVFRKYSKARVKLYVMMKVIVKISSGSS